MLRRGVPCVGAVCLLLLAAGVPAAPAPGLERESLSSVARYYGFGDVLVPGSELGLKSRYTSMAFTPNSRRLVFNGTLIWLNAPLVKNSADWTITRCDRDTILAPLLRPADTLRGKDIALVVLDPGHGGADPGAIGHRRVYEKKAALDIAKRAGRKLRDAGVVTRLTRERDSYVSLRARTDRAKWWGADIFVSIHLNSVHDSSVSGLETYVCSCQHFPSTSVGTPNGTAYPGNGYDAENMLLAYYLQRSMLASADGTDRGIKHARFDVLKQAPCAAALVECGFVSNEAEASRIIERSHRDALAAGIAQGILTYINKSKEKR